MSQPPPSPPPPPLPGDPGPNAAISYSTPASFEGDPFGKTFRQLRLAVTFAFIAAGFDGVAGIGALSIGVVGGIIESRPGRPGEDWIVAVFYGVWGLFLLAVGIVKLFAALKLRRCGPTARGWGLAAGIIGAAQFICGSCCWIQPAFGIYTIVVLSSQSARDLLSQFHEEGRTLE